MGDPFDSLIPDENHGLLFAARPFGSDHFRQIGGGSGQELNIYMFDSFQKAATFGCTPSGCQTWRLRLMRSRATRKKNCELRTHLPPGRPHADVRDGPPFIRF